MTFLKSTLKRIAFSVLAGLGGIALGATLVGAATTISTSVTTGGTLSVTGLSSLGQASSTMLSANSAYFGATATSTFGSDGALTLLGGLTGTTGSFSSTLSVTGLATFLGGATTTQITLLSGDTIKNAAASTTIMSGVVQATGGVVAQASSTVVGNFTTTGNAAVTGTLGITGDTTLASTTATGFKVGQVGTRHTGFVSGSCTIANVAVDASSTAMATCSSATGIVSGDKVFVQATYTLPDNFVIQAASTTEDAVIQVDILNIPTTTADSGTDDTGARSFNFWAVR